IAAHGLKLVAEDAVTAQVAEATLAHRATQLPLEGGAEDRPRVAAADGELPAPVHAADAHRGVDQELGGCDEAGGQAAQLAWSACRRTARSRHGHLLTCVPAQMAGRMAR